MIFQGKLNSLFQEYVLLFTKEIYKKHLRTDQDNLFLRQLQKFKPKKFK